MGPAVSSSEKIALKIGEIEPTVEVED